MLQEDKYLTGYVQGIFVSNYDLPARAVTVNEGIIIIHEDQLKGKNRDLILEKVKRLTSSLKGIKDVIVENNANYLPSNKSMIVVNDEYRNIAMPSHSLFEPLIADPKWPRFTVAYQYYFRDKDLKVKQAFAPNFGASFPLYRRVNNETHTEWEIGIQAGLFALMNIGTSPTALTKQPSAIS